jgi:hypothetical protein
MPSIVVSDSITPSESLSLVMNPSESVFPRGRLYLDNIEFTSDPDTYEANWEKRATRHEIIDGIVIQDFGKKAIDKIITLSSGAGLLENYVAYQFDLRSQQVGSTFNFRDWLNNEFTVYIMNFKAVPNFVGPLYKYEMTLQVLTIIKWYGISYVGS